MGKSASLPRDAVDFGALADNMLDASKLGLTLGDRRVFGAWGRLGVRPFAQGEDRTAVPEGKTKCSQVLNRIGIRYYLSSGDGTGFWDFFRISDHFYVSVTDATYRKKTPIQVDANGFSKIRVLLSGTLQAKNSDIIIAGPGALTFVAASASARDSYTIAPDQEMKMVVLHCRPKLFDETLGLSPDEVPPPFDAVFGRQQVSALHHIDLAPDIAQAALRLVEFRQTIRAHMRPTYLTATALEMLCRILSDLSNRQRFHSIHTRFTARDISCIFKARDYVTEHFVSPPVIPELARMVGINQTKLKAGFRELVGVSINQYIQQQRMERASKLILGCNQPIAVVAAMVGYKHPTNFTYAFKRHFGSLPKNWSRTTLRGTEAIRSDCSLPQTCSMSTQFASSERRIGGLPE